MPQLTLPPVLYAHLGVNLVSAAILVLCVYRRFRPGGGAAFTLVMLNLVTFGLTTLLASVSIDLGVSLGLFAIFGVLRYRTSPLDIGDLTYVFIVIGLAVLNGISIQSVSLADVLVLDTLIIATAWLLEYFARQNRAVMMKLRYDRVDFLAPSRRTELLADLSERLGVPCAAVTVQSVNLLMSTAELIVEFEDDVGIREVFRPRARSSFAPVLGTDRQG